MNQAYKSRVAIFIVWLFHVSGIIGTALGFVEWFLPKTALNLLISFGLVLWLFRISSIKEIATVLLLYAAGMLVEWIGVQYGFLFGDYRYGDNLGWKIDGVPWLIGVNWAMLVLITGAMAKSVTDKMWLQMAIGAGLMVALDLFIEPSAPLMDFWYWQLGHPPLQNYIAWFVIAFLLHGVYQKQINKGHIALSIHLFLAQLAFFIFFYLYFH